MHKPPADFQCWMPPLPGQAVRKPESHPNTDVKHFTSKMCHFQHPQKLKASLTSSPVALTLWCLFSLLCRTPFFPGVSPSPAPPCSHSEAWEPHLPLLPKSLSFTEKSSGTVGTVVSVPEEISGEEHQEIHLEKTTRVQRAEQGPGGRCHRPTAPSTAHPSVR